MIVGTQKPLQEIVSSVSEYHKVLVVGCGTCVTVCLTGGDKEARRLAAALDQEFSRKENPPSFDVLTIERQCERDWIASFLEIPNDTDAILSLACGAGVQTLAAVYKDLPVIPALNTTFLGALDRPGEWNEKCVGCGDCILTHTGGICPVALCAKRLFNGPCGGTLNGKCEISAVIGREVDCAWYLIIERLSRLGKLDEYHKIRQPKDWSAETAAGPRTLVHTG
ncbi:MAG: methylenetetrahydrofolate reductase C-terminal domain-containing protein [Thermodesulfobacteriota bacterium]